MADDAGWGVVELEQPEQDYICEPPKTSEQHGTAPRSELQETVLQAGSLDPILRSVRLEKSPHYTEGSDGAESKLWWRINAEDLQAVKRFLYQETTDVFDPGSE
jgi:hypothetical protein